MATPTYDPIASTTLTSSASSVTFSSLDTIAAGYRDLVLVFSGKGVATFRFQFNGDTGSNYNNVNMHGNGSSTQSQLLSNYTWILPANSSLDNTFNGTTQATIVVQIMDFSATDKHKSCLTRISRSNGLVVADTSRWASASAVTSILIGTNFVAGDTFSLYGIIA